MMAARRPPVRFLVMANKVAPARCGDGGVGRRVGVWFPPRRPLRVCVRVDPWVGEGSSGHGGYGVAEGGAVEAGDVECSWEGAAGGAEECEDDVAGADALV